MDILIIAVLIIAAVILFLVELFVIPGISLAGISALVCILLCICQFRHGRRIYHSWYIGDCLYRIIDLVYAIEDAGQTGIEKGY